MYGEDLFPQDESGQPVVPGNKSPGLPVREPQPEPEPAPRRFSIGPIIIVGVIVAGVIFLSRGRRAA